MYVASWIAFSSGSNLLSPVGRYRLAGWEARAGFSGPGEQRGVPGARGGGAHWRLRGLGSDMETSSASSALSTRAARTRRSGGAIAPAPLPAPALGLGHPPPEHRGTRCSCKATSLRDVAVQVCTLWCPRSVRCPQGKRGDANLSICVVLCVFFLGRVSSKRLSEMSPGCLRKHVSSFLHSRK